VTDISFNETFGIETSDDPLARLIKDLEQLKDYHFGITQLLPRVIVTLKQERRELLDDAEKRYTDLWNRIDQFVEDDEDSWVTAIRIIDHYKATWRKDK